MLALLTLAVCAAAFPLTSSSAPQIPIYYEYGGYPRIQTNISWGTPAQRVIPVIFDTGSVGFWTYGPGAIINDGSQFLGTSGPCNKKVNFYFDWKRSKTHSPVKNLTQSNVYSYGGNGKLVASYQQINDTMGFCGSDSVSVKNVQVALSNYTIVRQLDDKCRINVDTFDQSILGLAPFGVGGTSAGSTGPSFRSNLRDQGQIQSSMFSMWMKKAPADVKGTYQGTALLGEPLPRGSYVGSVVNVKLSPPKDSPYVGYYVGLPTISVKGHKLNVTDASVESCLLDSGTGQDQLPFSMDDVVKYSSGIIEYTSPEGFIFPAWNGSCSSIPASETFDVTFAGARKGHSAVIKIPVRSYARGTYASAADVCPLTFELGNFGGCTFGAPFFTAAALQFDDDTKQIGFAQGGIA